jgi:hypothetical protein
MFSAIVKQTCRATRSYATQVEHKAIVMDANGVIYRRLRKKLLALEDHLFKLGTYDKEKLISKINAAPDNEDIKAMRRRATIGEVSGRRYYEQILDWLEVRSEDREGK